MRPTQSDQPEPRQRERVGFGDALYQDAPSTVRQNSRKMLSTIFFWTVICDMRQRNDR